MNEELILKMAESSLKNGVLTYEVFDRIYGMLSRKEQYQVCEILHKNGIQLEDIYEDKELSSLTYDVTISEEQISDTEDDDTEPLFDESLFKDSENSGEYVLFYKDIKQSNDTLIRLIQEGNRQARQDICVKNESLVRKFANAYYRYFGNDLDFEDLMQAGYMGLLTAAEKFDFSKESAFSTYAVFWIKQAIHRQVADIGFRIRIPVHMIEKVAKITRLDNKYATDGMDYSQRINHIAEEMELTTEQVEEALSIKQQFLSTVSLDTPIGEEEDSTLGEFIPADDSFNVEDQIIQKSLSSDLDEILSTLTKTEQKVIRLRYGFYDGRPRTLEEIGNEIGVTRERIRQIESKALRKLRHPTRSNIIKNYNDSGG